VNGVPQTAPGLLAWIDSACEWELNRRRDFDYPLLPPEAAIDPPEDEVSQFSGPAEGRLRSIGTARSIHSRPTDYLMRGNIGRSG
jgi:hypothetical protein